MDKLLSKHLITAIPGIGVKYAERLGAAGIRKPRDLLKQYEKLGKDPILFSQWMRKQCQIKKANPGYTKKIFNAVKSFHTDEKVLGKEKETRPKASEVSQSVASTSKKSQAIVKSSVPIQLVPSVTKPSMNVATDTTDIDGNDELNQHLSKLRKQLTGMHDTANKKMLELQLELGKMQHMSREFDVLSQFLASDEKMTIFEQGLDRLQKTGRLTEVRLNEINANNVKLATLIRQINDSAKLQQKTNENSIKQIEENFGRWECKLDVMARKMSNSKIDVDAQKRLKKDIETVLSNRLDEFAANMEWTKNVTFCLFALIVLKSILFDFLQKGDANQ